MNEKEAKVGVYICHCGINISHTVDVEAVSTYAGTLNNVAVEPVAQRLHPSGLMMTPPGS